MINVEDEILLDTSTSVTKDVAIAKLLGWMRGHRRLKYIKVTATGICDDQLPHLPSLEGSLESIILNKIELTKDDFIRAVNSDADVEEIIRKEAIAEKWGGILEKYFVYSLDYDEELSKGDLSILKQDLAVSENDGGIHVTLTSLERWAIEKYDISVLSFESQNSTPVGTTDAKQPSLTPKPQQTPEKPWMVHDPRDPQPKYPWYTPARYFARQLVEDDTTLLGKRDLLCNKVTQSMDKVGIKKRGGQKPFDPGTVKNALVNVNLG